MSYARSFAPEPLTTSPPYGVVARPFEVPTIQPGTYGVGSSTLGNPGTTATGHRYSEVPVVHAYATKRWAESKFEQKQNKRQLLYNIRSSGKHPEVVPMLTVFQLNSLMRRMHETQRRSNLFRDGATPDADDKRAQIEELLAQLREGGELYLLGEGPRDNRMSKATRARTLKWFTAEGICDIVNYLGPYQNDAGRDDRGSWYTLNVVHQGPAIIDNFFQSIVGENTPGFEPELAPGIEMGDYLRLVLKRRFSVTTQQYEEFVIVPSVSQDRYATMEERLYEAYDGTDTYGPTWRVGRVLDVLGEKPDPRTVIRMRGIVNSWEDAYEAHGCNRSTLKISVGADRHEMYAA